MLKVITATTIALALLVSVMPYSVQAEETTAEQEQKFDVECNTTAGAYGQNSSANCKVLGKQSQRITLRRNVKPVDKLADTGVDTNVAITSTLTIAGGAVATLLRIKNQA